MRRPAGRWQSRHHRRLICQRRQVGTGRSDGRRQGYPTSGGSPRGHGASTENQASPGES